MSPPPRPGRRPRPIIRRTALTPAQRLEVREALAMLDGTGLTLREAVRRGLSGMAAVERLEVRQVVERFMLDLVRRHPRGTTLRWYENKLAPLVAAHGDRVLDTLTRADLLALAEEAPVGASTRASYHRAARVLWRWALRQEPPLAGADITLGLPTSAPAPTTTPEILAVDDVARILAAAGVDHRPALALMFFAGVRPQEIWGQDKPPLLWRHVIVEEQLVRVPAEISKTSARVLEGLPPAVWAWLPARSPDPDRPVSRVSSQHLIRLAQLAGGFRERTASGKRTRLLRPWPYDAPRHAFASYALALTGDAGRVAHWMGHEGAPRLVYTRYAATTTRAQALRYFGLRPGQA